MSLGTFAPKGHPAVADLTGCRAAVIEAVTAFQAIHPRTLQRALGPSEVGEECVRQLAYKLLEHPENPARGIDPWPSFLGIAAHARLADALDHDNTLHPGRWVTERRLRIPGIRDGGSGQSDAYFAPTFTTVDWKVLGNTTFQELANNGPGRKYRAQGHIYGLGWTAAGYRVDRVAIGAFGRAKPLSAMFVWSEPFNPAYAAAELQRVADVRAVVEWLQSRGVVSPEVIPPTPGGSCFFCEYYGNPALGFCAAEKS
jgi:hypothetical protein